MKTQYFFVCALLLTRPVLANVIDQQQLTYSTVADLLRDGRSGQTFTAGQDGLLGGISLLVMGDKWPGDYPFGSDFVLTLRPVANGAPVNAVLATGIGQKADLESEILKWVTVEFDTPYYQRSGETLAFTIQELSGGGSRGYNSYALAQDNPYFSGLRFSSYSEGVPLTDWNLDMAFQTTLIPEPGCVFMLALALMGRLWWVSRGGDQGR